MKQSGTKMKIKSRLLAIYDRRILEEECIDLYFHSIYVCLYGALKEKILLFDLK
jgi:hypothetical protein